MAYSGLGLRQKPTIKGTLGAAGSMLGGAAGALGAGALGLGGMASSVLGATPLVAGAGVIGAGIGKGAGLFGGKKDDDDDTKEAYAGLNLDILNAIYKEVAGIKSVLMGSDPESEKKEIALDAEVKHRELLAALMSGFGGGEGEKKKGGLFSWVLPALGGILAALGLGKLTGVIGDLGEYIEAIGTALGNIHEFITDIDTFFDGLGIEFAGAAILGTIKGMKVWDAIERLKSRLSDFGDRMKTRFANWTAKFDEWTKRLNNRWAAITKGFAAKMTGITDAFDKLKKRMGGYRVELSTRLKSIRAGFADRWTTLKDGFTKRMGTMADAFETHRIALAKRVGQWRVQLGVRWDSISKGFTAKMTALNEGLAKIRGRITTGLENIGKRIGGRFGALNQIAGKVASGSRSIVKTLGMAMDSIDDGIGRIGRSFGQAITDIDLKVKTVTGQITTHFQGLKNRLTNLLPKPTTPVKTPQYDTGRRGGRDLAVRGGTDADWSKPKARTRPAPLSKATSAYVKGIGAALPKSGVPGSGKALATSAGAAADAMPPMKPTDLTIPDADKAGGGKANAANAKLSQWLDNHPWIKKMLKPVAKTAAALGWAMMAWEIWTATKGWMEVADKWDMTPMGDSDADKVWQKEMKRIGAGYGGGMFGSVAGSMVGTMVAGPLGTIAGGLLGGVAGYFGGEALFNASQEERKVYTKPTERNQYKNKDVSGQEATMSAYGPSYDNITINQFTTTDASSNTSSSVSTETNVGFGGGNLNRNPSGYKASNAASPFAGRYP